MSQEERLQGLNDSVASIVTDEPAVPLTPGPPSTKSKSSTKKVVKDANLVSGIPYNTPQQKQRLDKCEWPDRLLYATRMLFGGNNVNGFLRGTATAQRIKKQRARQVAITKKAGSGGTLDGTETKDKGIGWDQEEEEKLKKEVMNPRTVKKLKAEMEASLQFCSQMHNLLRGIIMDVDKSQIPHLPPYLPPSSTVSNNPPPPTPRPPPVVTAPAPTPTPAVDNNPVMPWAVRNHGSASAELKEGGASKTTASAGNAEGSTLRKLRKKKLPPNTEPVPVIPEVDSAGRRLVNKKEHNVRVFEILRFRGLRAGDFVAARTTSRDLWILARVLKDYPGIENTPPLDFLQLSEARRDALFREKVQIKDVEGDGHTFQVGRNLVLPLPRTYSEAADWGSRLKKGMRCYSMYPQTTSLYPATVYDSTTYCRGQDDIIVVEFDGEDPDETGVIPKYHIPARFATLIPREFPSAQPPSASNKKRKSVGGATGRPIKQQKSEDFLSFDFEGNFGELDMDFDMDDGGGDGGFASLM